MKQILAILVVLAFVTSATAADWPQWLGPKRDGSTPDKVTAWKEGATPEILWRVPVTAGYSSPVVADGRVFVHATVKDKDEEEVIALDAASGKELWRHTYARPQYRSMFGAGPRATPTVVGKRFYGIGINGFLTCLDVEKGQRQWQVDLYKHFKADLPTFAVCCSPLVIGNRIIVSVGGKGRCIVAVNADSGAVEWQALDDVASTSSPVLFAGGARTAGTAPDVVFMTPLRLIGLDPLDGALRWDYPMVFQPAGTSPTPIAIGDKLVASTQAHGALAVRVKNKEDKLGAEPAWQNKEPRSYFSSGVGAGDLLFLVTNVVEPVPATGLTCLDALTGKQLWNREKIGYYHAGLIRTGDGKLLILSDSGHLSLLEADAKGAKELCRAKICGGTFANPALAGNRLYARDDKEVICVRVAD